MIKILRGFKDILPNNIELWKHIEKTACITLENFGYREIRTPIIEKISLFTKSIGKKTDIIEKEMYHFLKDGIKTSAMRPEATASIVRAYIEHKFHIAEPVSKFYTIGPMFRRERPQKGRYRQFYQIDAESFGIEFPYAEVELIYIIKTLFSKLLINNVIIHINSLGCVNCKQKYKTYLVNLLSNSIADLCPDCVRRKDTNPLRVLDCKVKKCKEILYNSLGNFDFLCYECKKHFETVIDLLEKFNIPFKINKYLVRGLDYYTKTIFEIFSDTLGSQSAIAGGGRYDKLVNMLGGPDIPAVGFAIGLDRIIETVKLNFNLLMSSHDIFIAVIGTKQLEISFKLQMQLCENGINTCLGKYTQSLKSQMRQANRLNISCVIIIGEKETKTNNVILRDMKTKIQSNIPINNIVNLLIDKFIK